MNSNADNEIQALLEAVRKLPLWTPVLRENREYDVLYGYTASEYYPSAVLVDAEKLVRIREALDVIDHAEE